MKRITISKINYIKDLKMIRGAFRRSFIGKAHFGLVSEYNNRVN